MRIWLAGVYRREARTEDGRRVTVRFPGHPGGPGGPDVRGARIELDGVERVGDVELHRVPSGWHRHGHAHDGAYADVILHVALFRDPSAPPRSRYGGIVAELILAPLLGEAPRELARRLRETAPTAPPEVNRHRLLEAGGERMERRIERLTRLLEAERGDDVLYREFLTALGYRLNRAPFRELARRVPWQRLLELELPVGEILGYAAGFAPGPPVPRIRPMASSLWRWFGVRPANYPERRLAAAAPFLEAARRMGGLWPLVWEAARSGRDLETLASRLGPERRQGIAWSVWAPACLLRARLQGKREIEIAILKDYRRRPLVGEDAAVRRLGRGLGRLSVQEAEGLRALWRRAGTWEESA